MLCAENYLALALLPTQEVEKRELGKAVIIPTGSSAGARMVRAIVSAQPKDSTNQGRCGQENPMILPGQKPNCMRNDQPNKPDYTAY